MFFHSYIILPIWGTFYRCPVGSWVFCVCTHCFLSFLILDALSDRHTQRCFSQKIWCTCGPLEILYFSESLPYSWHCNSIIFCFSSFHLTLPICFFMLHTSPHQITPLIHIWLGKSYMPTIPSGSDWFWYLLCLLTYYVSQKYGIELLILVLLCWNVNTICAWVKANDQAVVW